MSAEDFIRIIDELGKRIEGPARHLFELAIRQVYVDFFVGFVGFAVLGVTVTLQSRYYWKLYKGGREFIDGPFVMFFSTIVASAAFLLSLVGVLSSIGGVFNPEWAAIHKIAGTVIP